MYIMKKILLGALIASTALMATSAATAAVTIDQADFKPYVGLDYSYLSGFDKVALDDAGDDTKYLDGHVNVLGVSFGDELLAAKATSFRKQPKLQSSLLTFHRQCEKEL